MRRVSSLLVVSLICASVATPQGRPVDWPSYGGDARRTGWQRSDIRITKDNIKDFQLVLKRKLESPQSDGRSLTAPVVIGLLISYRGFKELGFIANSSGDLWSLDVDLNRVFWQKRFAGSPQKASGLCAGWATTPALTPPMTFGGRRRPTGPPSGTASPSPGQPPTTAGRTTELPARVGGGGFGAPRPVYLLASNGKLHQVNSSDGSDQFPPLDFLPANAKASSLTLNDNVMYTTTSGDCGGTTDAVWALDLAEIEPKTVSFALKGGDAPALGGFAVGTDGTVYVPVGPGPSDAASNKFSNSLLALSAKNLTLKGHFSAPAGNPGTAGTSGMNLATPVVFDYKGRDLIVSAGHDGRLYLLDSQSVGGSDGKTPLHQTSPISSAEGGIWGGLSSWEDESGVRWVAAPVWGPLNPALKPAATNGAAPNGSVVAFRVEDQSGRPVLTPAWVSRDLSSPVPPVVTSGVVFALSTGGYTGQGPQLKPKSGGRAVLYALDGASGKEMYSTGEQVTAPGNLTGLTVANGRVFFTTADGTLYGFGIFMEI